jgi:hypothetical protein
MPATSCLPTTFNRAVSKISGLYFAEKCMKRPIGSPPLTLASSVTEKTPVADSDEKLHSVLATLEQCRAALSQSGDRETALLVSVAVLELRMKLHHIEDAELKALCDAMVSERAPEQASQEPKSPHGHGHGPRRRPLLKLVK